MEKSGNGRKRSGNTFSFMGHKRDVKAPSGVFERKCVVGSGRGVERERESSKPASSFMDYILRTINSCRRWLCT